MAANFWIAIPINDFFHYSSEVMKKYGVSAYIELIGEILQCSNLGDYKRLKEILAETKSRLQMALPSWAKPYK